MMKKCLILFLSFISLSLFAQPVVVENGLKFMGRKYTDKELDAMVFPEVKINNYETFYHSGIVNNTVAKVFFDRSYEYLSPSLTLENDKNGKQYFHVFLDPSTDYDKNVSKEDEKCRSSVEIRTPSLIKNDTFLEFSFIPETEKCWNESVSIVILSVHVNNRARGMFSVKLRNGHIFAGFNEVDESIPPEDPKFPKLVYNEVDLGPVENHTEGRIRVAMNNGEITTTFNGNSATSKVSPMIDYNSKIHYQFGIRPKTTRPAFYELFFSDINFRAGDY